MGFFSYPASWGPVFWTEMHIAALDYSSKLPEIKDDGTPEKQEAIARWEEHMKTTEEMTVAYFAGLPYRLPCPKCGNHLLMHYKKLPYEEYVRGTMGTMKLFEYTVDLHNAVNEMLGKPTYTYDEAMKHYRDKFSATTADGLKLMYSIRDSDEKRKQDNAKIKALKEQIEVLKNGGSIETNDPANDEYPMTNYILGLTGASVLVFILILFILLR